MFKVMKDHVTRCNKSVFNPFRAESVAQRNKLYEALDTDFLSVDFLIKEHEVL